MTQGDLPFVRGSATSRAAAESMTESAATIRSKVLAAVVAAGSAGMTCDEIEVALGLRHQTASARVRELAKAGAIRSAWQAGPPNLRHKKTRLTRSGRSAQVWIVAKP